MIKNPNSLLFLNQLSSIVRATDKVALTPGVDYTVLPNTFINGTILSDNEISLDSALNVNQGQGVIIEIDGYNFKYIVDNVDEGNENMLLQGTLSNKAGRVIDSGAVRVKMESNVIVQLSNLAEGHYIIKPANLKMVIRESFVQPYVSFDELSAKKLDVQNLTESRVSSLNTLALKMIYSDLSSFDNYYDIIDEVDLWKLLFLKIICLLTDDYRIEKDSKDLTPCQKYEKALNVYAPKEKFVENEDGTSSEVIDNAIATGRYSL